MSPNDGGARGETSSEEQQGDHLEANMAVLACGSSGSDEQFMVGGYPDAASACSAAAES